MSTKFVDCGVRNEFRNLKNSNSISQRFHASNKNVPWNEFITLETANPFLKRRAETLCLCHLVVPFIALCATLKSSNRLSRTSKKWRHSNISQVRRFLFRGVACAGQSVTLALSTLDLCLPSIAYHWLTSKPLEHSGFLCFHHPLVLPRNLQKVWAVLLLIRMSAVVALPSNLRLLSMGCAFWLGMRLSFLDRSGASACGAYGVSFLSTPFAPLSVHSTNSFKHGSGNRRDGSFS